MNTPSLTSCPDRAQIQQLLSGQTSSAEFAGLEAHLLACDSCSRAADALISAADVTAMLARAETQVIRTREVELVEQLIRKVRNLRSRPSTAIEQTHIGVGHAVPDQSGGASTANARMETRHAATHTVAVEAGAVSFLRPAEQSDEIGRLGGYRILEVLGSGGMGVVYRAEDAKLKRQVALKVMKPVVAANPEARTRFLKEAEAAAAIEHDNIVTIYQVGEDNGVPFIAMQFLKGESLQQRIDREGKLPQSEVLRIGREIADGLQAAHARGLIHRDIKPDNIWLQEGNDRVRIVDFGLVRNSADEAGLTQSGIVLGTPRYMAPEQARGESVDGRSDLFSLGSVLYRLVSGRAPFEGSNLTATLIAVAHEEPQPLHRLAPEVNPQLARLINSLLSKNPAARPATAADVASELRLIESAAVHRTAAGTNLQAGAAGSAGTAAPVATVEPLLNETAGAGPRPPRSRSLLAAVGGCAALLLLAVLVIKLRTKDGMLVIELDSPIPVSQVEIDGSQVRFQADVSGRLLTVSVPEGTHELVLKTPEGLSLTTELGAKPVQVTVSETTKIRAWLENAVTVADQSKSEASTAVNHSSATKSVASIEMQPNTRMEIRNNPADEASVTAIRRTSKLWPAGAFPAWASEEPRWSIMKDSFTIPGVVERPSEFTSVGRWNVDTVRSRGVIIVARYSPDGKWLATGSSDGHVRVYDSVTMNLYQLLPGLSGSHGAVDLSWHPDSQKIAVAADNASQLRIWTIDGQLLLEEVAGVETWSTINSVAWTFDGSRLICGGANRLEVRDAAGTLIKTLVGGQDGPHCNFGSIAVSPDRQRFIVWQFDAARIWNSETFELEATIPIPCSNGTGGHRVRWSSRDRISLSTFEQLTICNADGTVLKEFPTESLCAAAWHPDGENLTIWRWDPYNLNSTSGELTPEDQRIAVAAGVGTVPTAIDWSPDGKRIVLAGGRLVVCKDSISQIEYDSDITLMTVSSISLNPDGSQIASVSQISDDCVRLWSSDGTAQGSMPLYEPLLASPRVTWSPDGGSVAVAWPQSNHFRIGQPGGDFLTIAGNCVSLAWSPDGRQLAAGLTNGHILITDADGKILHDLDTAEAGGVAVGWSKQGSLVAHAGQKILRIDPTSSESKILLLTDAPAGPSGHVPVWRPDGKELFMSYDIHVNVADGVAERIRQASPAVAWAPDGSKYLFTASHVTSLLRPDGNPMLTRVTNASTTSLTGAWSPSGERVYVGYDQSLLVARNAEDLHVQWAAVILPKQKSVTFDVGGSVLDGDRETLDSQLVYYAADRAGNVELLSPAEFELRAGEEILPVPGRFFDGEYGLTLTVSDKWKSASTKSALVPGIPRATFNRPGEVSMHFFVQDTGGPVDPAWMLAESVRSQQEKFSATVLESEIRTVAGRPAMWMVIEANGTGSVIDGVGTVRTTQHWIAIPRTTDVVVALLNSPSGTFQVSQELFLQTVATLSLRDLGPQP